MKKILDRIPVVVEEEKNAIKERLAIIESLVALEDIDDDDDIKEIVKQIRAFYNRANESHIGAALRMDNTLLLACSKMQALYIVL